MNTIRSTKSTKTKGQCGRTRIAGCLTITISIVLAAPTLFPQTAGFHDAPPSASQTKNPLAHQADAVKTGAAIFEKKCSLCHGPNGEGKSGVPSLARTSVQSASDGAIFWFITKGDIPAGMPSWSSLTEKERWQVVSYVKSLGRVKPNALVRRETEVGP